MPDYFQILLRATVEMGIIVIPKTTNPERMKENINIFDFNISNAEVNLLEAHERTKQERLFWWPKYFFLSNKNDTEHYFSALLIILKIHSRHRDNKCPKEI